MGNACCLQDAPKLKVELRVRELSHEVLNSCLLLASGARSHTASTPTNRERGILATMSEENLDLAFQTLEAFNRHDLDAFLALMHDEIEIESRLVAIEGGYHGHEGVRRWWSNFLDVLPDYTAEVEELHDLGDITLGRVRGRGHPADSTAPLIDTFWQPIRWRDAKCIWWRNCPTKAEALEAIGFRD
jgi:ketosteroid isomerase-like protein